MTYSYNDVRWTPLDEYESRADEYDEPWGPLPRVWRIATSDPIELGCTMQPTITMVQDLALAVLDLREQVLGAQRAAL